MIISFLIIMNDINILKSIIQNIKEENIEIKLASKYYSSKIEQEILADAARILGAIGCSLDCLVE